MFKFDLGSRVRDKITGYVGTIVARIEYLNGCKRYSVQAKVKDEKIPEPEWLDEQQLELIEELEEAIKQDSTGGDRRVPKSMTVPPAFGSEKSL